jgi:quercetin dioxygenase-like cupin family protein
MSMVAPQEDVAQQMSEALLVSVVYYNSVLVREAHRSIVICVKEASGAQLMKPDEQYGPVGKRILFENDLVRVWEISLEPGEHLPQHYHALPYLVLTIEAARVRVVEHDGQAYDPTDASGDVTFREAGQIHELQNISPSRYVNRLIEIKQPHKREE